MREDQHSLAGAYALDALPDNRRRRFERHLERCGACRQEVRGLQETASRLGAAAAEQPPPELRTRVMAEVARTRQLPPVLPEAVPVTRSVWLPRLAVSVAAACLAVIVAVGAVLVRTQDRLEEARARNAAISQVLAAPDAESVRQRVTTGGSATIVVSRSQNSAVFAGSGLADLPDSQGYELWLMEPGNIRPAGMLEPGTGVRYEPAILRDLDSAAQIGLTVEPAGGSPQPTSEPVLVAELT